MRDNCGDAWRGVGDGLDGMVYGWRTGDEGLQKLGFLAVLVNLGAALYCEGRRGPRRQPDGDR